MSHILSHALNVGHGIEILFNNRNMNAEAVVSDHFCNKLCVTDSIKQPLWLLTTTFAALYAF